MLTEAVAQGPVCADLLHRPHQLSHGPDQSKGRQEEEARAWAFISHSGTTGTRRQHWAPASKGAGKGEGALGGVLGCLTHSKV